VEGEDSHRCALICKIWFAISILQLLFCRNVGVLGLYRGAGITMARDVPSSAIFFACYTLLQQLYPDQNFMAGCLAAIPATVLVTLMDIIKTCLQV
jgi:hypothetical protein